jgi:uncharacterized membrane protein
MRLASIFRKPIVNPPLWVPITVGIIALLGFADAAYLTIEHFMNELPPCVFGNCELVLTSKYSEIFGIPVALLGAIYYFAILFFIVMYFDGKREKFLRAALWLSWVGLLASIWFFILQAFVIHAFCQFCLISGATSLTLFIISVCALRRYRPNI